MKPATSTHNSNFFILCLFVMRAATEEWAKRVDVSGVSSISLSMNTLVSFVVSLYLRKAIIIWWDSIHQEFYRLWNIAENLCMRTAIYFPTTSNLDTESRQLVFRYCLLSIALFFKVID